MGGAQGFPRSLIVRSGVAVPARPSRVGRSDTAVVPPRPAIMPDGHRPAVPLVTAMDGQFGTHKLYVSADGADSLVSGVEWRSRVVAASGRNPPMTMLCLSRLGGGGQGLCGRVLTRSGDDCYLVGGDRGLALLADQRGVQLAAALGVLREARRARRPGQVVVAPVHEGEERDEQLAAHRGKPVVKAVGVLLVADSFEYSGVDEPTKPVGEHVAAEAETCLELLETAQPQEGVPDEEQTPALADHL
jgi:hypothetical protein